MLFGLCRRLMVHGSKLTRRECESRTEAIRGGHEECLAVTRPSQIGEGSVVQIADNAQRFMLLRVVYMHGILSGNCVDNAIWQTKRGNRTGRRP